MLWLSFHPFCLCLSCLGIFSLMFLCLLYWLEILQLCYSFFFAVSLFSVTSPFRTCSFPLHGLMEFYILACRFSATPGAYFALLYHRSKKIFERSLVPFCGMGFVPSIIFDSWFSYCQYPLALDVFSRPTLQLFFIACLMVRP